MAGWVNTYGTTNRCNGFSEPPLGSFGVQAREYWQGVQLSVPGQGTQEVLKRSAAYSAAPGPVSQYPLVTHQNWQLSCLPTIQNGAGEGFIAISPEGVRYRFDWMATRAQTSVKARATTGTMGRMDVFLMATEVTDRHGNWVRYTYDPVAPMNLQRVESNDGRVITLAYAAGRVASASDGTRTFTYSYDALGDLQYVNQPDGSRWTFSLRAMVPLRMTNIGEGANCDNPGDFLADDEVPPGVIVHPSGATGTFKTAFRLMGRAYVTRQCIVSQSNPLRTVGAVWPRSSPTQVLLSKQISGPGMPNETWTYSYASPASWSTCTTGCSDTRTVTVQQPDGGVTRHIFGNRWRVNEGQLQRTDEGWDGTNALRTTTYQYRNPAGQNFPDQFGFSLYSNSDWLSSRHRPQDQVVVTQQGATFTWQADPGAAGFDAYARPRLVTKSSSLGFSKTEATVLQDFPALWVLGQRQNVTDLPAGIVVEANDYDPATALKTASYSFGRKTLGFAYNPDGTVATLFDAAGRPIQFQNFMRGKPQRAVFADGTVASRTVNNLGNVASSTNEAGTTTSFDFDAMGRVSRVDRPLGNPTFQAFVQIWNVELGLPPGHWRQAIINGQSFVLRYFDAQWRVRVTQKMDVDDMANTMSFVETRYDAKGRKSFESYPLRSFTQVDDPSTKGKSFEYDAMDRPTVQRADSELGVLTTTTQYLSPFRKQVINPRGFSTFYSYQAFDTPSEDHIKSIDAADGSQTVIDRDQFAAARFIERLGTYAGSSQQARRSYYYDTHRRLCKTVEPETGSTLQGYDAAGNLAWRASGLPASQLPCDQDAAPPNRTTSFSYDARDRLTTTTFGDGQPGISRSYTADGLLQQLVSSSFTWTYSYDARRLLTQESFSVPGQTPGTGWNFTYTLNDNGHVAALTDPWGAVNYSPNALGQPTQVSGYAGGVKYHANGMVSDYTLANGITHRVTQNTRGLPQEWQDGNVNFDVYSYDANGNVMGIQDALPGGIHRVMQPYDPVDRLKQVSGAWGTATYDYDALDNLRSSQVGGRSLTHTVDPATNRLTGLSGSQSLGFAYDASGNVIQRGGQAFSFDLGNRMRVAHGKASYDYDGHGRRSWVVFANGSTQLNAYSGTGVVGRLMLSNHSSKGGTRYVYLDGKLIAEHNNQTGVSYSHTDALGSVVAHSDSAGLVQGAKTRYEPYGATALGDVPQSIGFTGHVNDADTGLVYMQQRYYEPLAGRFLSIDPISPDTRTGGQFNRYQYADSNPYVYFDPDGRSAATAIAYRGMSLSAQVRGGGQWTGASGITEANQRIAAGLSQALSNSRNGNSESSTGGSGSIEGQTTATAAAGGPGGGCGELHHICTDKNEKKPDAEGGPWTPQFRKMFDKADMKLSDSENIVRLKGHAGPHPPAYHRYVFRYLEGRTEGLVGAEYSQALRSGLRELAREIATPGSPLNRMLIK